MRILKLHHPEGSHWSNGEFKIELPAGTFYNISQHTQDIPGYAKYSTNYSEPHRIEVRNDGIYYQKCACSSGCGKTNVGEPFLIIPNAEYDNIVYVGQPLEPSHALLDDLKWMNNE